MKKLLFLAAFSFSFTISSAQTEAEKVTSTITQDKIKGHIYFLADDLLNGRETNTTGLKIAASYLANTLRGYGVKPNPQTDTYYQEVPLRRTKIPEMSFSIAGEPVNRIVAVSLGELDYNAELVYLNYGLKEDYEGKDVKDKFVIFKAGKPEITDPRLAYSMINEKKELAKRAGAIGVAEIVKLDDDAVWQQIEHGVNIERLELLSDEEANEAELPYLWINGNQLEQEISLYAIDELKGTFHMDKPVTDTIVSQNVIGVIEGTDPKLRNEYVIYSAHYDHVGIGAPDAEGDTIYNGARDNAVGTTTVLSMAENLSSYPTKRSALFVLFTGEEAGLHGSRFYVNNPILPLEQVVYVFNSDNAGYNDTSVATIIGLERTTAAPHIKKAATTFGITAIEDPAPDEQLFDRSDNVSFAAKGIPAPTFSLGFRSFDGDVTKYYHQPADEAETLDYDYLIKFFQTYVLAGRLIANDPVTPFWTPGDKYEPAGKQLYNKN